MRFLRTAPTSRLAAVIGGLIATIAACTAIAVAASGSGPVPRSKPLAQAIRGSLSAPAVPGITADVTFANHLINASDIQGSDPILTGASGRLWLSQDHRLRLELQSDNGDAQVVVNKTSFWAYDPSSNTVYEGTLPANAAREKPRTKKEQIPSLAEIQKELRHARQHATVSGAIPSDVADHPAYTVRISPQHDGGLLGFAELAWDAIRGVPLRFAVYARNDSSPVLELKATKISYRAVSPSVFSISPPTGAKVVKVASPGGGEKKGARDHGRGRHQQVTGPAAVARHLHFKLVSPGKLVGLPRQSVTLLDWNGSPAALVTYGQNLGGLAVVEQSASSSKSQSQTTSSGHDRRGLNLPTVSINGATGQELDTALGTVVRFTRAGVTYTVLGSVPAAAAEAAARAL